MNSATTGSSRWRLRAGNSEGLGGDCENRVGAVCVRWKRRSKLERVESGEEESRL